MRKVLAIESSCDETAVAILEESTQGNPPKLLASLISTQIAIHRQYGGVVPEVASRNHSLNLPFLIRETCKKANLSPNEIDAFGATAGPGLASSLLVGNTTAKTLAFACSKPFISVNHLEGHMWSPFFESPNGPAPHLSLIVSGGHTLLIDVKNFGNYTLMGRSLDDAAGEAFDKVAKMLGLPYPGGPEIEKRAKKGNPQAFAFPRAMLKDKHSDMSFSGLKTAVLYTIPKIAPSGDPKEISQEQMNDICASFQAAVIDVLVKKTLRLAKALGHKKIAMSGGVACNKTLRDAMNTACQKAHIELLISPAAMSTDNAAMIAYVALLKFQQNHFNKLDEDVDPNLRLTAEKNRS